MSAVISSARYGKDNVRVYKVEKDQSTGVQTVIEMTVCVLLEGAIDTSYAIPIISVQFQRLTELQIHQSR